MTWPKGIPTGFRVQPPRTTTDIVFLGPCTASYLDLLGAVHYARWSRCIANQRSQPARAINMAQTSKLAVLAALMMLAGACKGSLIDDGVFDTCSEALDKIPGYDFTTKVLSQCPDLQKLPSDPTLVKTFFVPSNEAIQTICDHLGIPLEKVLDGELKSVMCQLLRYHIVDGRYTLEQWKTGQGFKTMYFGAKLTVKATGDEPAVRPLLGSAGKVEHKALCGESVAYGIDAVLAPFPIAKLPALSG